ncbi:Chalcone domain-containing protein [Cephalotus follicularis]|uniref:Chalcone domain-containing protein n=1 Tax=Cephalotus follicularis TaxID=3775 RepID=A0A1Q3BKK5_CEPFO|nr:Chalcone domain-containing protein [Cephalotus follicularis]
MENTAEKVIAKAEKVEDKGNGANGEMVKEMVNGENGVKAVEESTTEEVEVKEIAQEEASNELPNEKGKEEEVAVVIEPKTGVPFPIMLDDGKQLSCVGLRKKSMLGMSIKIYGFGLYADTEKLRDVLKSKIGKAPAKPTKEMYQVVIDNDVEMMVRLVIVYSSLTMNMVRKSFDEGLGASIKKLTGKKDDELSTKVMGQASDAIKLIPGSVIEISRLPGYILQTKISGEMVSKVESELLCRAYIHMYVGDDALDKDAKEKFGISLLSLF